MLSESGTDGSGGAFDEVAVAVGAALLLEPVSPTEALVAPPLVSHGFGGDGEDMNPLVPPHRTVVRFCVAMQSLQSSRSLSPMRDCADVKEVGNDGDREASLRGSPGSQLQNGRLRVGCLALHE